LILVWRKFSKFSQSDQIVKARSQVLGMATYVRLEQFFESQMSKEQAVACSVFVDQLLRHCPIFGSSIAPIGDLFFDIKHIRLSENMV